MTEVMLLIPLVVGHKLMTCVEFLMASYLKLVEVRQMTFGTEMSEEV